MAITYVNGAIGTADGSGSSIAAAAFAATTGNAIFVCVGLNSSRTVSSIADTAGNTYSQAGQYINSTNTVEIWFAQNIIGNASNVVTVTQSGSATRRRVSVTQYSGCATSSIQDTGYAPAGKADNTDPVISTAASTAEANELIIGAFFCTSNDDYITAEAGTTLRSTIPVGDPRTFATCQRITTTAGSYTVGFSTDGGSSQWIIITSAFKEPGSAPVSYVSIDHATGRGVFRGVMVGVG